MAFSLAIFGGTFDPIHLGHIKLAQALQQTFHFDEIHLLPCKLPVLKEAAKASTIQRIEMLELAIKGLDQFIIDRREIDRNTPSYMVETLRDLRKQYGSKASINLVLGSDAFRQLPQWYQFNEIKNLANCIIIKRRETPASPLPPELLNFIDNTMTSDKNQILRQSHGLIMDIDAGDYPISSTSIRKKIALGEDLSQLLPPSVINYIKDQQLYV